jgi:hypothetical protein
MEKHRGDMSPLGMFWLSRLPAARLAVCIEEQNFLQGAVERREHLQLPAFEPGFHALKSFESESPATVPRKA